jgi:WD40 repeat protein
VRTSQCIQTLQGHSNSIYSIALSPDGQFLASGNEDQTVKLWNINTKTFTTLPSACASSDFATDLRTLQGHSNRVFCVAFSPDSQILASCSGDRTIKLWNPITGQCLNTFYGHNSWVWSLLLVQMDKYSQVAV